MRKKAFAFLCCMALSLLLTACFDAKEIGDYAYVANIGIERGVGNRFRITFQIPLFEAAGGGGGGAGASGGGPKEKDTMTIEAPTFFEGINLANTSIPLTINFMHLRTIVISEDLATSGLLGEFISPLVRYREIRRSTNIIICKGSAAEFVEAAKPYLGISVTQTMENMINNYKYNGFYPNVTLNDLSNALKCTNQEPFAIYAAVNKGEKMPPDGSKYSGKFENTGDYYAGDVPRKNGPEIELMGCAINNGDIMVGKLTGFETQMFLLLRGDLKRLIIAVEDPERQGLSIPVEIKEFERPKTKVKIQGGKINIDSHLSLEGDILAIQSRINYEEPTKKKSVEAAMKKLLEDGIAKTVKKCQNFNTDVFHYGQIAVRQFPTIQEWEKFNWLQKFSSSNIKVTVDFTVRRTGTMTKSSSVKSSRGVEK